MKYRFTLTDRLGTLVVAPVSTGDISLTYTPEKEGKRYYKMELPKKLKFSGEAFQRLMALENSIYRCSDIKIVVEQICSTPTGETSQVKFTGRVVLNESDFDLHNQLIETKLTEYQDYSCYEDNKDEEINILQAITTPIMVNLFKTVNLEYITKTKTNDASTGIGGVMNCGAPAWDEATSAESQGWAVVENTWMFTANQTGGIGGNVPGVCQTTTRYAREITNVDCAQPAPGPEWIYISTSQSPPDAQVGFCLMKYARPASVYGCTVTINQDTVNSTYYGESRKCLVAGDSANMQSVDNGRLVADVLQYFANNFCGATTVKSNFFQINPDVVSPNNYVTGAASKTAHLVIFQKSDVKRPGVSGNATVANLTWEKLLNALTTFYWTNWRIEMDLAGKSIFRIEHVSYYDPGVGMDLTGPEFARFFIDKNRYTYENTRVVIREEYSTMEASFGDFKGLPITYPSRCLAAESKDNVATYSVDDFTTDVQLCLTAGLINSDVVSDQGFVLMACTLNNGMYEVITENPILDQTSTVNNSLAWAQLHRDYHRYERPQQLGNMNGQETVFLSTIPTKKGATFSIPLCCGQEFNPDKKIRTLLGEGVVSKATENGVTGMIEIDLLYNVNQDLVINQPPTAANKVVKINNDQTADINLFEGSADADGTVVSFEIVTPPVHGTLTNLPTGVKYTPAAGYAGDDYIIYRVKDNWSEPSSNAIVAIVINDPETPPADNDLFFTYSMNTVNGFKINPPGVLIGQPAGYVAPDEPFLNVPYGYVSLYPDGGVLFAPLTYTDPGGGGSFSFHDVTSIFEVEISNGTDAKTIRVHIYIP
jgi:hypothetical protein